MKLTVTPERQCGSCTKCCEGAVHGKVNGIAFYKGAPCQYCVPSQGCSIYEDRPEDPCKTFKCSWLEDYSVPEWMKPNLSGAIVFVKETEGFVFPVINPVKENFSVDVLSWFILWGLQKYGLVVWFNSEGSRFYLGPSEFGEALERFDAKVL